MSNLVSATYWEMCQINPSQVRGGYRYCEIETAKSLIEQEFCDLSHIQSSEIQYKLLNLFHSQNPNTNMLCRVDAGFSLRCLVSHPILKACRKIDNLFASNNSFTYKDLLPFVLNDDGKTAIVLDQDSKTQLIVDQKGNTQTSSYNFFSVKILGTYNFESSSRMSLENWTYLQTKQNRELKKFLSEFGFKLLSDWALLNRVRAKQLENLVERDRHLITVFHEVYRRDRRQQIHTKIKRCPDPNETQLREMLTSLSQKGITIKTTNSMLQELKQVATQLRQYDIWNSRVPLEIQQSETEAYTPRSDLPHTFIDEEKVEEQEFLEFLHQQLQKVLVEAIAKEIHLKLMKLKKSKRYAPFVSKFILGLELYYCENKSLKEIAPELGMTSWDQARRILDPGGILSRVREQCVQKLLEIILAQASQKGLTELPPKPDYLKAIIQQIESFVDQKVFNEAAAEIRAGKNRSFDSLYAQELRLCCQKYK